MKSFVDELKKELIRLQALCEFYNVNLPENVSDQIKYIDHILKEFLLGADDIVIVSKKSMKNLITYNVTPHNEIIANFHLQNRKLIEEKIMQKWWDANDEFKSKVKEALAEELIDYLSRM